MKNGTKAIVEKALLQMMGRETAVYPAIPVDSPQWFHWLNHHDRFKFNGAGGHFTARRETRRGSYYWYAYRRRNGKLHKAYLGKAEEVTLTSLEEASAKLAGETVLSQLSLPANSHTNQAGKLWMNRSLLSFTKIRPPALPPRLIPRPHLTGKISTQITFICAPGGFGKSTLLNAWRQARNIPVAWATLDTDDNHIYRFWSTVIMALQAVFPGIGQNLLTELRMSTPTVHPEIVARLTNELAQLKGDSFRIALILDDYHHIQDANIHASVQQWLEHLPPVLQLIIAGRFRSPFALGRLRAMGLVTELDMDDLRFTFEESTKFLAQYTEQYPLAFSDKETLINRTGGWVAGLALAMLALTKQQEPRHFIDTFSGAHLFLQEYFMESVLHQQPTAVQTFLIKTSVLKHLTGGLCDAVTGQTNGEEMLSRLWQENLFIIRSEEEAWYRYHDLFAEMLRGQLTLRLPDETPHLHRRAANWYRRQNAPSDAVRHLLAIKDWEEAASLIEDVVLRELEISGEDSRLLRWLQQMPETVVQHHKTLLFVYLRLANLALHPREVERFLLRIESNILSKPAAEVTQDEEAVLTEIHNIRLQITAGYSAVSRLPAGGVHGNRWQLLNELLLVEIYHKPRSEGAGKLLQSLYDKASQQGNLFVALISGASITNRAYVKGDLRRSEKLGYQVLQHALTQRGKLPEPSSIVLVILSRICLERDELTQADQLLHRATAVDPNPTSSNMPISTAVVRARLQSVLGQHKAAQATIQAARELYRRRPPGSWRDRDLAAYEAMFCVRQGNWEEAERLLSESAETTEHAMSELVRAEMLFMQGQAAGAEAILSRFVVQYENGLLNEPTLCARVLWALALFDLHKVNQARQVLAEAVRFAAPERFIRPFLDYPPQQTASLLTLVLHTKNLVTTEAQTFIGEILQRLGYTNGTAQQMPDRELAALSTAASITARELDVLHLLQDGLSNRAIAIKLCISPSTVKTHLVNIYSKLNVDSRVQAVAEAQTLELI